MGGKETQRCILHQRFVFAFNYLHSIAKALKQNGEADEVIDFWIENAFVKRFIRI